MTTTATETEDKLESARTQARAQLDSIRDMVERLEHSADCDGDEDCTQTDKEIYAGLSLYPSREPATQGMREDYHNEDEARQRIHEDALSAEVRSGWHTPGADEDNEDAEYRIVLCTGGPAVQIIGTLGRWNEPDSATLECQDWFTPWTTVHITGDDERILMAYVREFYFGE